MFRAAAVVLVVLAFPPKPVPAQFSSQPVQVFSGEVASGAWLRIRNLRGAIDVREASGRNVVVTASTRQEEDDRGNVTFRIVRDGANVTVCAIWPRTSRCDAGGYDYDSDYRSRGDRQQGRVDFVVALPKGVRLVAAHGEVDAHTGNGEIKVSTSSGPVSATTGNGGINVDMKSLSNMSDMDFSTGNGSIAVSFPSNLSATIEAHVSMKEFETDFPMEMASRWGGERIEGKIGRGGPRIRFSTGHGRVSIQKNG